MDLLDRVRHYQYTPEDARMLSIVGAGACVVVWLMRYVNVWMQVRGLKTYWSLIDIVTSPLRSKLPNIPVLLPSSQWNNNKEHPWKKFADSKTDLIACTTAVSSRPTYVVGSPTTFAYMAARPQQYGKPVDNMRYALTNIFGLHIVSLQNGPEHRRHKAVVKGSFGEEILVAVWDHAVDTYRLMVQEEGVANGGVLHEFRELMTKFTQVVFCIAGFGQRLPWQMAKETHEGYMEFPEAMAVFEETIMQQLAFPVWLMDAMPLASTKRIARAAKSMKYQMEKLISDKRLDIEHKKSVLGDGEKLEAQRDLLGAIVNAQISIEQETGTKMAGLRAEEVLANVFVFMIAGHETTAHTLGFTIGYLAAFPEWQDKLYEELTSVCGIEEPTYRDISRLPTFLACCQEALRLRDLSVYIPKMTLEDTVLPYTTWDDAGNVTQHQHHIKKGTNVILDAAAIGLSPQHWRDPDTYDPSRWLGDEGVQSRAHQSGFSFGNRMCIGKRFAEVEMVSLLSHMVRDYRLVMVPKGGESHEAMRQRYQFGSLELSFTPGDWDLGLEKRL